MKTAIFMIGVMVLPAAILAAGMLAVAAPAQAARVVVADFNSGEKPNNIGGNFGTWNYDPKDTTQGCYESFEPDDVKDPENGYSLRIDYDVLSPKPAFNGVWMKMQGLDASPYQTLSFWVKGFGENFTSRFKVELKTHKGERAVYPADGVTASWQEIRIPFKDTKAITDFSKLDELVFVFDDIVATYKEGILLVDEVSFDSEPARPELEAAEDDEEDKDEGEDPDEEE